MLDLNFHHVDDLGLAISNGTLVKSDRPLFRLQNIGPFMEMAAISRPSPSVRETVYSYFEEGYFSEMLAALRSNARCWRSQETGQTGFFKCGRHANPSGQLELQFAEWLAIAAGQAGFDKSLSNQFVAALNELEDNIFEHSENAETGVLVYHSIPGRFEFSVTDRGIGALGSLRENSQFSKLTDHGRALELVIKEGVSSRGANSGGGFGFRRLFTGLANLNCDLRFRSGDHALTITGDTNDVKNAQLSQKSFISGFMVNVFCEV